MHVFFLVRVLYFIQWTHASYFDAHAHVLKFDAIDALACFVGCPQARGYIAARARVVFPGVAQRSDRPALQTLDR